jgi:hypothetical protein
MLGRDANHRVVAAVPALQQDARALAANAGDGKAGDGVKRSAAAIVHAAENIETTVRTHQRPREDVRRVVCASGCG